MKTYDDIGKELGLHRTTIENVLRFLMRQGLSIMSNYSKLFLALIELYIVELLLQININMTELKNIAWIPITIIKRNRRN